MGLEKKMEATMVFSLGLLVLLGREWGFGWRIIIAAFLGTTVGILSPVPHNSLGYVSQEVWHSHFCVLTAFVIRTYTPRL